MSEARLIELEIKLGFAEDAIDTLNQTVFRQQEMLESLQAQLRHLYSSLTRALDTEPRALGSLRDEIPPHY